MTFKEYMQMQQEGLRTILNKRIEPDNPAVAGAKAAGDIALDFVPGAGIAKAVGELAWDVLKYRQDKVNFDQINQWSDYHYKRLLHAGINPKRVFHMDPQFGESLSDKALMDIMTKVLKALDASEQHGYTEVKKKPALAEIAAFKYVREHLLTLKSSIQGELEDAPLKYGTAVQAPTTNPGQKGWYTWQDQYWYFDGQTWHQGTNNGKEQILQLTRGMMEKGRQEDEQRQQQQRKGPPPLPGQGKGWWPFGRGQ